MDKRAIVMAFHKYTPFGDEFYEPILDFQIKTLRKYADEYDSWYILDSTWNIDLSKDTRLNGLRCQVIKVNPSLRYYDAYKEILPQIKEDLVLFMDNDMVVYQSAIIYDVFDNLDSAKLDVVSIMDAIGTYKTNKLFLGNKFCPYWFATRKELLMKYLDVEWGPDMPYCETLGHLTEVSVNDGVRIREVEDDKTEATFINGEVKTEKNLGYYHIRAGSTPAYLLATKHYGDRKTYDDYLKNQPKSEIIRHCNWYRYIGGNPDEILADL